MFARDDRMTREIDDGPTNESDEARWRLKRSYGGQAKNAGSASACSL